MSHEHCKSHILLCSCQQYLYYDKLLMNDRLSVVTSRKENKRVTSAEDELYDSNQSGLVLNVY